MLVLPGVFCYPGGVSLLVLTSGGFRVEPRVARRPPARLVVMLGWWPDWGVPSSSCAPLRAWLFLLHPVCAVPHGGTAAMACPTEKVANIIGESDAR